MAVPCGAVMAGGWMQGFSTHLADSGQGKSSGVRGKDILP